MWTSDAHLRDHFRRHGWKLGCQTVDEYDASAQATLLSGRFFRYFDETSEQYRLGCFDETTGRFVVLVDSPDFDEIVSHYPCDARYVRRLPDNNYDEEGV
jgi:hypothetical protein